MRATRAKPRLYRDLLLWLMLPLLAVVAATGAVGTFTAQYLTDRVFDRWLLDAARSLAGQVRFVDGAARLDLPAAARAVLTYDDIDQTWFYVEQNGHRLAGQSGIPASGERSTEHPSGRTYDAAINGRAVRVASVTLPGERGDVSVRMAETTLKRQRTQREILLMLAPVGVLLLAAAAAIGFAVRRTVRPLEQIAARWNQQSQMSLQAIGAEDVPRELMPFATALNDLLARIRAMLVRERQFAAMVAHQLRTPLTGLQLGLARAAEAPDLDSARRTLGDLGQLTQRTARLVQQLLALGHLEPEARADLEFSPGDLRTLAYDVGATFLDQAASRCITLELDTPPRPVTATLHAGLIGEALGNLLDNALRYTPAHGRVLIDFEAQPPAVRVSDSGPGIPDDMKESLFERFARGGHVDGEGSGLGLAIVRDIAALHGASVSLARGALGGTCATIRFPAAADGGNDQRR